MIIEILDIISVSLLSLGIGIMIGVEFINPIIKEFRDNQRE